MRFGVLMVGWPANDLIMKTVLAFFDMGLQS